MKDRNVYSKIEAMVRKSLFDGITTGQIIEDSKSEGVFLINELIRDYMQFQGYGHTLSVFEAGILLLNVGIKFILILNRYRID